MGQLSLIEVKSKQSVPIYEGPEYRGIDMGLPEIPALIQGDNLEILKTFPDEFIDLAYLDPPFFTGENQTLFDRTLSTTDTTRLSFKDIWASTEEYLEWIRLRLQEVHRVLKPTGSVFLQGL